MPFALEWPTLSPGPNLRDSRSRLPRIGYRVPRVLPRLAVYRQRGTDMHETLPDRSPGLLIQVAGRSEPVRFAGSVSIGRNPTNDLVIDDRSVSGRHAEVVYKRGRWLMRDLGSTNGTVVSGQMINEVELTGPTRARLGHRGPSLILTPEDSAAADLEVTQELSESDIFRRYFSRHDPEDMGERTAILRRVYAAVQRKKSRTYLIAVAVLIALAGTAAGYALHLHEQVERQRALASELFYSAKALELEVFGLQLTAAERSAYGTRRAELQRGYRDLVDELGVYDDDTPAEVQLVYRVARRFGESEVNIPAEFVEEVLRHVERWRVGDRLARAIARAHENGYAQRIAEIMLEHDLPPEFFYLALQESDLDPWAVGPETRFDLGPLVGVRRRDPLDDRHDFEKSTRAAARYLRRIYRTDAQASGLLVIASYNWGQTRVIRLIREMPEHPAERNFWQLLRQAPEIPSETYGYVFSIVSAAVIGEDPALFGFDFEPPLQRPEIPEPEVILAK